MSASIKMGGVGSVHAMARHMSKEEQEAIAEHLFVRASTAGAELEAKRNEISAVGLRVESLLAEILDEKSRLTQEDKETKYNAANLYAMVGIIRGLEYVGDCLSRRRVHRIKGGEIGYSRLSIAEMMKDLNTFIDDDEEGAIAILRTQLQMTEEMGRAQHAFKDENGVADPDKYRRGGNPQAGHSESEVDESVAVPAKKLEEAQRKSMEQALKEKTKKDR